MRNETPRELAQKVRLEKAAHHHTDLNIFHAVVAILESGAVYTQQGGTTARKIVKLCNAEAQRQLRLYDLASGRKL